ncbi:P-type ATPase, HAD-like domain protein [Artemisia annua]|uniref:Phospholipid-transporting ATPase n=1 Tax=Artemisia annua TaxID=35608 RepID=A0A2U1QIS0_ARTAN|nr:P-type ATPase, HAD-like domain protein [Artemisia annua]
MATQPSSNDQTKKKKKKGKMKWSNLYTFSCLRPSQPTNHPSDFGQPGFSRVVFCNDSVKHKTKPYKYPSNHVSTTKYNVITFLPKSLFEQFRRVANLYFLLVAVLSVTSLAPFTPLSMIAPLVFVVGISMLKEGIEDWHRFLQDLEVNSRKVKVHAGNGIFVDRTWKVVQVGDVVKVNKNEYFPSDLLLLSSSYEDGVCYVETMNLDGETNLKIKRCLECTLSFDQETKFDKFKATVRCEDPNSSLYTFVANLEFGDDESYSLSPSQILLRDSKLRNTDYVYGVAIFTGKDAKVVRNSMKSPSKRSRIERKMDHVIYVLFFMLLLISLITSIGSVEYTDQEHIAKEWWYLRLRDDTDGSFDPDKPLISGFLQFLRALILYGYLIPISLYVSIEVVKFLQAMLINNDQHLFDEMSGKSVEARTSNLNEELGQVEMILTDKTGTLTCNQMEFRKCSIEGISYGGDANEIVRAASQRLNIDIESYRFNLDDANSTPGHSMELVEMSSGQIKESRNSILDDEHAKKNIEASGIKGFNFKDERLMNKMWLHGSNVWDMIFFFRVLALCHTGIPVEDEQTGSHKLKYEAESPEEVTFLIAAQEFGFQFYKRTQSSMFVKEIDSSAVEVKREYKLLNLLEFSSSRKRMSVIVRDEAGQIFLFCKGADNIIFDRLGDGGRTYQHATTMHLANYAEDGLRTMVFGYRKIKDSEYEEWSSSFAKAKSIIGPEREEMLENVSETIEKELVLLGAVAVDDKLQDGVAECIDKLAQAGIKIWLLTGDKKETAVNIGFACSLLRHDMQQFHLSLSRDAESKNQLEAMKDDILNQIEASYHVTISEQTKDDPFALVVDGKALEIALRNDLRDHFLQLAVNCASVICCRVSPKQKALITRLVKRYTGKMTLAIGDGANDVGMIQEADIGIGISGMEGMQAVMASDFSMPQFRFLERLLIVHGHWCYKRISKMILYFVYKNIVFGLTLFYYELYSRFSGDVLYDGWYMVVFNLFLTSLPVISLGVLEQDVSSDICLQFPALYQQGQKGILFGWKRIIGWMGNGILTSLVIFILTVYILSPSAFRQGGEVADIAHLGVITYTSVVWTVNCQIALIITHFTWIQHIFIWGSILSWYIFLLLYGALPPIYSNREYKLLVEAVGPAPMYWIVVLLVVVISLLPYFIYMVIQRSFFPMDDHVIQEMKYGGRKAVVDDETWFREKQSSRKATHIGLSSRVDAKILYLKDQLHKKRMFIINSFTNSPIRRSLTVNPLENRD